VSAVLAAALAAEEAAIYAYGPIGVKLAGAEQDEARTAEATHRSRRDALVLRLATLRASPSAAPPGYRLPYPVTDRATALTLAVEVEAAVAATWRAALRGTEGEDRGTAVDALTDAAVRATRWRRIAGVNPITVPFPGKL
jgi:hypothetical protein